ncbi:MAG: 23S rRNA (adenine(2503)-C(2))-methyltransferase RlmN [Phycisphaerales bacterium]
MQAREPQPANHIFEFTPETLGAWLVARGSQKFRAAQVLDWVYQKGVVDPAAMSNLSKRDRDLLADPHEGLTFLSGDLRAHQRASDGTQKLLIEWRPGRAAAPEAATTLPADLPLAVLDPAHAGVRAAATSECVMIPVQPDGGPARRTACISSQIGCPVGCRFCASGIGGLEHNLSAGRIVEQVWRLGQLHTLETPAKGEAQVGAALSRRETRVTNVVFMGMGEPLANLGNVIPAIRTINSLWALGISARKVTVSTVGLPQAIERLAAELDLPVTLALSLHAPTDQLRRELIPWAEYTTIRDLLDACQKWFEKTGREITLEYTLLRGVNDQREHAEELARLARTLRANVNLIRYNEVTGMPFQRPADDAVLAFQGVLRARNVNAHIRASRGRDIAAACGQLRHESRSERLASSGT